MRTSWIYRVVAVTIISVLLLSSCKPAETTPTNNVSPDTEEVTATDSNPEETGSETSSAPTDVPPSLPSETAAAESVSETPTNAPTPTPIVETRLPPERWQEWPVIPELTGREAAIYQVGLALGNDPTHFSKIGDCQAIKEVLMGIYDLPERYRLKEDQAYLQETIDHFAGSFNRDGQGVRGGFNTAAVISPLWADPEACQPGETPIECEYRIHKPSFVIISLEVWWEGRTVDRYETYMRQIIEFYIDNGVVPILSTKADNVEGDHRINLATARLAYEYHIPLWNFWLAVQPLPNHGIDPNRDGFHISYEAWSVRSFTALQALDAVWRGVREESAASPETPTATQEPEVTFAEVQLAPTPQSLPVPPEGEKILFSFFQRSGEKTQSAGVFIYQPADNALYQLFGPGTQLEDIHPDGNQLLISQGSQLFLSDLSGQTTPITDKLTISPQNASALWGPDGTWLAVLTDEAEGQTIWRVNLADMQWQLIASGEITGILKVISGGDIYWYQGQCNAESGCESNTIWKTQNGESALFAETYRAAISDDDSQYAWAETTEDNLIVIYKRSVDQSLQDFLYLPGNRLIDMAWGPFDTRLGVLTVTRSNYSGKSSDVRIFIVNSIDMSHLEYFALPGINAGLAWHPNGEDLLLYATQATDTGYQLHFRQMNLTSGLFDTLDEMLTITSENFISINQLFWIIP